VTPDNLSDVLEGLLRLLASRCCAKWCADSRPSSAIQLTQGPLLAIVCLPFHDSFPLAFVFKFAFEPFRH
jgi:hypothetical protein